MRVRAGGSGDEVLVLLHGLGATSDVWAGWEPLLARHWPGRWLAPDLPGHGGSPPLTGYSFDSSAAAIAALIQDASGVVLLGHSLGGVIALAMAGGERSLPVPPVRAVIGLGIKVAWTDAELGRARELASRPVRWFGSRDEAADRYLRVSGLTGLLAADDPAVDAGLIARDGRWRLAVDPSAFAVGAPGMPDLIARSRAPVTLARGELDPMNTDEQLTAFGVPVVTLPGLGHNAHAENPAQAISLLPAP